MEYPCDKCIVSACCTQVCEDLAEYIYRYPPTSDIKKYFHSLDYDAAMKYIITCETIVRNLDDIEDLEFPT